MWIRFNIAYIFFFNLSLPTTVALIYELYGMKFIAHDWQGEVWVHLWTQEETEGGREVLVPAPLGHTPVFYRKGSSWTALFQDIATRFL